MTDLERLAAIQDIKHLRSRYLRLLDTRQFDEAISLYTPDATMRMEADAPGVLFEGPAAIRELMASSLTDVITVHHAQMAEITFESPDIAHAIWALQDNLWFGPGSVAPGQHIRGFGHLHDVYVRVDGAWFISRVEITRLKVELAVI